MSGGASQSRARLSRHLLVRTFPADAIAREQKSGDERICRERAIHFHQARNLVARRLVVDFVVRQIDNGRVSTLRAGKLHNSANALARDLVAREVDLSDWERLGSFRREARDLGDPAGVRRRTRGNEIW